MSNGMRAAVAALVVIAAGVAFVLARPEEESPAPSAATRTETGAPSTGAAAPRPAPKPAYAEVRVRDGGPAGEARTIAVEKGDTVRIAFRSDADGEVHVHGYDEYVNLEAGSTTRVRFPADIEGIFEIEEHGSGEQLAKLKVEP